MTRMCNECGHGEHERRCGEVVELGAADERRAGEGVAGAIAEYTTRGRATCGCTETSADGDNDDDDLDDDVAGRYEDDDM